MKARLLVGAAIGAIASVLLGSAAPAPKKSLAASAVETPHSDCDALPDGVTEIAGLRTAWAIRSADSSALRLQFADEVHGCREPETPSGECLTLWRFGFTLLPELQKPGVHRLNDYEVNYSDFIAQTIPASGCNDEEGCGTRAVGSAGGAKGPDATIEIYSVTDTCVTGRVLRLDQGWSSPPPPDFTGGFRAAICSREP